MSSFFDGDEDPPPLTPQTAALKEVEESNIADHKAFMRRLSTVIHLRRKVSSSALMSHSASEGHPDEASESESAVVAGTFAADITLEDLKGLKERFDEVAEDGGELDEDEFIAAFAPLVGDTMAHEEMRVWFQRIDASDNGKVDWKEFSTFMLLSGEQLRMEEESTAATFVKDQRATSMPATEPSATNISGYNHSDLVTSLKVHSSSGKYFTGSQDGTVRVWNGNTLEMTNVMHVSKSWVTSMDMMRKDTRLCVTSIDRVVSVYEAHSEKLFRAFVGDSFATTRMMLQRPRNMSRDDVDTRGTHVGKNMRRAPQPAKGSRAEAEQRVKRQTRSLDATNMVEHYVLRGMDSHATACCPLHRNSDDGVMALGLNTGVVQVYDLFAQTFSGVLEPSFNKEIHHAAITSIHTCHTIGGLVTTAADGTIRCISFDRDRIWSVGEGHVGHARTIHGAAYHESTRMLATCGTERHVLLWSLNGQAAPLTLKGHLSSVMQVVFDEAHNQLVSVDSDKYIRVWDLRTYRCIQVIQDADDYLPQDLITVVAKDTRRNCLVTATVAPVTWSVSQNLVPFPDPNYKGHQKPVVAVVYNPLYHQVATADCDSVHQWSSVTGEHISCLLNLSRSGVDATAIASTVTDESDMGLVIQAMGLDGTSKRLMCALTNGTVLMYNYANGQLLTEMIPARNGDHERRKTVKEATGLLYASFGTKKVVCTVQGRDVLVWEDLGDGAYEKRVDLVVNTAITEKVYLHFKGFDTPKTYTGWRQPTPVSILGIPPLHIALGTDTGVTLIWNLLSDMTSAVLGDFEATVGIQALAFNERKEQLFCARSDGKIHVYNLQTREQIAELVARDTNANSDFLTVNPNVELAVPNLSCLAIDEKRRTLVAGDDEGYVYIFDVGKMDTFSKPRRETRRVTLAANTFANKAKVFRAHASEVTQLTVFTRPSGIKLIATCSNDCQSRVFTMQGEVVGYCGSPEAWSTANPHPNEYLRDVPAPVRVFTPVPHELHRDGSFTMKELLSARSSALNGSINFGSPQQFGASISTRTSGPPVPNIPLSARDKTVREDVDLPVQPHTYRPHVAKVADYTFQAHGRHMRMNKVRQGQAMRVSDTVGHRLAARDAEQLMSEGSMSTSQRPPSLDARDGIGVMPPIRSPRIRDTSNASSSNSLTGRYPSMTMDLPSLALTTTLAMSGSTEYTSPKHFPSPPNGSRGGGNFFPAVKGAARRPPPLDPSSFRAKPDVTITHANSVTACAAEQDLSKGEDLTIQAKIEMWKASRQRTFGMPTNDWSRRALARLRVPPPTLTAANMGPVSVVGARGAGFFKS